MNMVYTRIYMSYTFVKFVVSIILIPPNLLCFYSRLRLMPLRILSTNYHIFEDLKLTVDRAVSMLGVWE
jgi:hypothetical protein